MGKLMVVADSNEKCAATPRGLQLARKLGHATEVVAFVYTSLKALDVDVAHRATIKARLLAEREKVVAARIAKYRGENQKVKLKVVWSKDPIPWIVKRAGSSYAAVVKTGLGSESRSYSSADWQLLRESPVAVLIVADKKWHHTKPVLAALDLGTKSREKRALNDRVLDNARHMADALQAELKIISAVEVPVLLAELDLVDPAAHAKAQKAEMAPYVKAMAARHNLPVGLFKVKRGPVAKVITSEAAEVRAQLVVMGTVGRKGMRARLLGNTAESVLTLLRTDVLAVKPE